MPFDSEGVFSRLHNWEDDRVNDIDIVTDHMDEEDDNFADGLSQCFLKNGNSKMEGHLNVGNFKVMNVADGALKTDAVNRKQLDGVETSLTEAFASAKEELEESIDSAKTELTEGIETAVSDLGEERVGFPSYQDWVNFGDDYTTPYSGWVVIAFAHYSSGRNTLTVTINGVVMGTFNSDDYDNQNLVFPLKKGDRIQTSGANVLIRKFCAMR